ncbi:hypothetical protein [Enterovibrio coralii]|uniref:Uncharacterized protein n=1 Tax=Enterovibrio coralii TaxID=294935 RepID=A0A135ID89_9GAMM|nr:hypothetical protein [Enterovibrio coralii]KXF83409.1 hypothetical protein ATN88_07115 [Enterovibrio coralii]
MADILLRRSIEQGGLISISAAFLCQMWTPLPPVYWRTERRLPQASEDPAKQRLLQWLYGQLLNQNRSHINHRLDLVGLDGIWQLVGSALWAGHSGSWVWLKHILKEIRTAKASETGLTQTLLVLVEQWVMQALENEKGVDSLQLKLSAYESDAIFKAEPLNYEEISSMSKLDWMECIRRHPLIPDTWFRQLEDAQIIVFEEIRDDSFFPHYADALCFYRAVNRDFKLSSCWADEVFDGVFNWALWFYSHLATGGAEKQTIRGTLTELPDTQTTQQLGLLLLFSEEEGQYLPDAVTLLNRYPEQFVFRLIVDRQVTLAESLFNHEVLMEKAKSGDLMAVMALSRLIKEEHFDEAIVLWNIVAAESLRFPHLQAVVDWQQQSLLRVREEKGLEQESYEYSKPEFIHAMLTTNREWFTEPKLIQENDPVDEAKPFHYPMLLLLTQLHLGLSEEGYDLSPLKELANRREKQTALQRDVTDVAVTQLENVYQNRLEQDIEVKGGKAATYSKKRLVFLSIAMFLVWIFIFPWSVLSFPDATFEQVFRSSVFMTVIQGLLIWQISRPIIEKSNKNKYIGYSLFTYFAALIFKAPFIALVNVFSHLYLASSLPPLYAKGGWNRAVVATRKINMRKVLGFKK